MSTPRRTTDVLISFEVTEKHLIVLSPERLAQIKADRGLAADTSLDDLIEHFKADPSALGCLAEEPETEHLGAWDGCVTGYGHLLGSHLELVRSEVSA